MMDKSNGIGGSPGRLSAKQEFARGWRVLFGATFGVGLGISGLLTYNLGLFATDLRREIGLGPAAYGATLLALNVALAAAVPLAGRVVDSVGPRAAAAGGAAFLALGFVGLSLVTSVPSYSAVLVAIGLFASLSAPIAHTRAVAVTFETQRGLALGITQVGIGLAAALVPPLVAMQIASRGWQSGFLLLAALAALGIVPALLGLPRTVKSGKPSDGDKAMESRLGSSATFWLQLSAFTAMALAFIGLIAHFVPMLRESGMPLQTAGALAGAIGLSVIVTRLVVGWLADRIEPAWLGAASCLICGAGAFAIAEGGPALALPAALAFGCAIGAEADLIGILTARNFPLGSYSRAYSAQYASFTLAGGVSPLLVGVLVEASGGYRTPLLLCAVLLLIPVLLFALLARRTRD